MQANRAPLLACLVLACGRNAAPPEELPTVSRDLREVHDWFDEEPDATRIIAMLSPT